jgi:hypothetical protein
MVNSKEQRKMTQLTKGKRIYFKKEIGAYSMARDTTPDFLEVKPLHCFSYATTPGFGPGYVNTSAVIVRYYSAKITRELTEEDERALKYHLICGKLFADRAEMSADAKEMKATAKAYIKKEEAAWKRQGYKL